MIYYISILFFCSKYFAMYLDYRIIYESLMQYLFILFEILFFIIFCKYAMKKSQYLSVNERIYSYSLEYDIEKYFTFFIINIFLIFYIFLIIYLRIKSFNSKIDLGIITQHLVDLYYKYDIITLVLNLFMLLLLFYLIFLFIKIIRNYVHVEIVKFHFLCLNISTYKKFHESLTFKWSIDALIIQKIIEKIFELKIRLALGYSKNILKFTKQEDILYEDFCNKYNKYFPLYVIRNIFYSLHIILFFVFFIWDILFNNAILIYTSKFLPFMLLYNIYLTISKFVFEKPLTDICAHINMIFYCKVKIINKKTIMVDNILQEIDLEQFVKDFISYENSGFTKYY